MLYDYTDNFFLVVEEIKKHLVNQNPHIATFRATAEIQYHQFSSLIQLHISKNTMTRIA